MKYTTAIRANALRAAALTTLFGTASSAMAVNLLVNPGFEAPPETTQTNTNIAGWTPVNATPRASFGVANNTPGGLYGLWLRTFQPIGGGATQLVTGITGGAEYNFSGWLNVENGFSAIEDPVALRLQLRWLDAGNSPVGTPATLDLTPQSGITPLVFAQYTLTANAPVGAVNVEVFAGFDGGGISSVQPQSAFWDDLILDGPGTPPPDNQWILDTSGNWNVGGNWSNGSVPDGVGVGVNLLGAITAGRTVYSDTAITAGTITMTNANTYVIAGAGSLTLQASSGNAAINVGAGTQKINIPTFLGSNTTATVAAGATLVIADPLNLNGRTFTPAGAGTTLIEAPVRSTAPGSIVVAGGTTVLNYGIGDAATPSAAAVANTSLQVTGSKAVINANQNLRGLDAVTANAGDQEIDVGTALVRVYPANRAAEEAAIIADIKAAIASGSGRDGIYSSADPGPSFSVGVTDQAIDARGDLHVLVRLTRNGDANLDGAVNLNDFTALAAQFGSSGTWDQGDFNYSGAVDLNDFTELAANFGLSAGDVARGAVPEPASFGVIALAAGLVARRRR
ncbi:MAG TPA: hypothetical protein PLD59_12805 [Tepidisphaeraceae bacterium]|nr:hypothetical protein [Tepidisphaeraceae bacterium]